MWIADLAIFREWINNDQQVTTTLLSVGIEICSQSILGIQSFNFFWQIVELFVFVWTNIVTHLLQEFAFSQNVSILIIFNLGRIICLLYFLGNLTV